MNTSMEMKKMIKTEIKQANQEQFKKTVAIRTAELHDANLKLKNEIAQHKKTELALGRAEKWFHKIAEASKDMIHLYDPLGRILYTNPVSETLLGYSEKELLGQNIDTFLHQEDEDLMKSNRLDLLGCETAVMPLEIRMIKKNGELLYIESNAFFLSPDGHESYIGAILRDITSSKQFQSYLIQNERLIATGRLSASIAHEINSPLQGIVALISVLKKHYAADENLLNDLELLKGAFDKIKVTANKLLSFNRPVKRETQTISVNVIIRDTLSLLRSYLRQNKVNLTMDLAQNIPSIDVKPQMIEQCLVNIINNSVEAMALPPPSRQQGAKDNFKKRSISVRTYLMDENVVVEIADSGPGIPAEHLHQIFEPHYTTKKKMGMGIGLSICHNIVKNHKGRIEICNRTNEGALVRIRFRSFIVAEE